MSWLPDLRGEGRGAGVPDIPEISVFEQYQFGPGKTVITQQFE